MAEVLKDPTKRKEVLTPETQSRLMWTKWGLRAFVTMFVGIGFLALSNVRSLHTVGLVGAIAMLFLAGGMTVQMWRYRSELRRADGGQPRGIDRPDTS